MMSETSWSPFHWFGSEVLFLVWGRTRQPLWDLSGRSGFRQSCRLEQTHQSARSVKNVVTELDRGTCLRQKVNRPGLLIYGRKYMEERMKTGAPVTCMGDKRNPYREKLKKGKLRPITGYDSPDGEERYISTLSLTSSLELGWDIKATPLPLYPRERDPVPTV